MKPLSIILVVALSVFLCLLQANASIDSGGEMGTVGVLLSHSSLGSPFSTSSVTAGGIDLLYPIQVKLPSTPEMPPIASPAVVGSPAGESPAGNAPVSKKGKKGASKMKTKPANNNKLTSQSKSKSTSQSKKKTKKK